MPFLSIDSAALPWSVEKDQHLEWRKYDKNTFIALCIYSALHKESRVVEELFFINFMDYLLIMH